MKGVYFWRNGGGVRELESEGVWELESLGVGEAIAAIPLSLTPSLSHSPTPQNRMLSMFFFARKPLINKGFKKRVLKSICYLQKR